MLLKCSGGRLRTSQRKLGIAPGDHRVNKTIRSDCAAAVNIRRIDGGVFLKSVSLVHNHRRHLNEGTRAPMRILPVHKSKVAELVASRVSVSAILFSFRSLRICN